ncbi:MAG: hypothetical protein VYC34_07130 [Planctomycetota bacterium]|nr:hypothetical protein [Planctomycetota bacterium]
MKRLIANVFAVYELIRLGWITRFRFKGPYWRWRMHTAFGRGFPESRWEMLRMLLAYGRWMHRMRRSM